MRVARVAVLRAYILYWGFGRHRRRRRHPGRRRSGDRRHVEPDLGGGHPGRHADVPGAPDEAAAHIRPVLDQDGLSPRALVASRTALALGWAWSGRP